MKNILLLTTLLTFNSYAFDYFTELRFGVRDQYSKKVVRNDSVVLSGDFEGMNFGLRVGAKKDEHSLLVELNLPQKVEVESANEEAEVQSFLIGYRYNWKGLFAGAHLGYSRYELEKGPNGITFQDNPTTSGFIYGINAGYQYIFEKHYIVGIDFMYSLASYKDDGPSTTNVNTIEIEGQNQINLTVGYQF